MLHGVHCLLVKHMGSLELSLFCIKVGCIHSALVSQLLSRFEKFHGHSDVNSST